MSLNLFNLKSTISILTKQLLGKDIRRVKKVSWGLIEFDKELSKSFCLVVKHAEIFSALIEQLVRKYPVFVIIRNPLATLASWSSVSFPVNQGRSLVAEAIEPNLRILLDKYDKLYERQIHLLEWYFKKYANYLSKLNVIRYEKIINTKGKILKMIHPDAVYLNEPLRNKNKNCLYNYHVVQNIAKHLLSINGVIWNFYSKNDVKSLLSEYH